MIEWNHRYRKGKKDEGNEERKETKKRGERKGTGEEMRTNLYALQILTLTSTSFLPNKKALSIRLQAEKMAGDVGMCRRGNVESFGEGRGEESE